MASGIHALLCIILISLFCLLATAVNIAWTTLPITTPPRLVRTDGVRTVYDVNTDLVWLLGAAFSRGIFRWNMTSGDNMTFVGVLADNTWANAQDWVVKDDIIYWVFSKSIHSFSMSSAMEIANDLNAHFPFRASDACVTTDNDKYLLVIGGSGLDEEFSVVDQIKV
eukprot:469243_1